MAVDMEAPAASDATSRRKSGRAVQVPLRYQQDPAVAGNVNGSSKRKRPSDAAKVDDSDDSLEESDDDMSEVENRKRKPAKASIPSQRAGKKPAAKKPKGSQGDGVRLAMRPAANGIKKSSKPRKPSAKQIPPEARDSALYADLFASNKSAEAIAASWVEAYNHHNAQAMCDLVNFVIKCTGCALGVEIHDIEDPDNATSKLTDLQDEFGGTEIIDYPLISKARGLAFSRVQLEDFFQTLVETAHATGILYSDEALIENIQVWVTTLTSSSLRPFRHTATVISLAMASGACNNLKEIVTGTALTVRQRDSEQKRKSANKGRIAALDAKIAENERKKEKTEELLKDIFDTVFIHRYRDVDSRIRVDCTSALGDWIVTCPDLFFEGQYLRYLGWLLSDIVASVRAEVLKQLLRIYDTNNTGRLRAFTERFRARLVEMATKDAESSVRAGSAELLLAIRKLSLLEPGDVDAVGRLIFDADSRVRKAITPFFAANVEDTYEAVVHELGGSEALEEALGEDDPNEYEQPRRSWLRLKCIAELIDGYDVDRSEAGTPAPGVEGLIAAAHADTRYSVAAEVVCDGTEELHAWEPIAGYLLYDFSTHARTKRKNDPLHAIKARCQLTDKEERLLLEVLIAAVRAQLAEASDVVLEVKTRKPKSRKDASRSIEEVTAAHLSQMIPRLLHKYEGNPLNTSAILRLAHVLNVDALSNVRHDVSDYNKLLENVAKQFSSHADAAVLTEASTALLHAAEFEELEETTENRIQELWAMVITHLRQSARANQVQVADLAVAADRLAKLALISDCVSVFEARPNSTPKSKSSAEQRVLDILLAKINYYSSVVDANTDSFIINAIKAVFAYYMWIASSLKGKSDAGETITDLPDYERFEGALTQVIEARTKLDETRLAASSALLDLHVLFASFRATAKQPETENASLACEVVSEKVQHEILASFLAAESAFAKKTGRALEDPTEDDLTDEPESDPEDEPEDDEDDDDNEADEDGVTHRKQRRAQEKLLAERRLCEIAGKMVLAILARVLDGSGPSAGRLRKRLVRNRAKLGPNFKEVVAFLDSPRAKRTARGRTTKGEKSEKAGRQAKSSEVVGLEDDDDPIQDAEDEEERLRREELLEPAVEDAAETVTADPPEEDEDQVMGD